MVNYILSLILLLILGCTSPIHGSCMRSRLVSQVTRRFYHFSSSFLLSLSTLGYGTTNQYCRYNEIKVLPGSMFKLSAPDCLDCRCTLQGLRCCGFGFAAGVVVPPPGCRARNDACNLIFVREDNPSELCELSTSRKSNIMPPFN